MEKFLHGTICVDGKIKPGMQAEYKRRHDAIWPEMKAR